MARETTGPVDLEGQTAVITGASGGIGQATCVALAREGANIVAADVDLDGLNEVRDKVEAQNQDCVIVECDVSSKDDVRRLSDQASNAFESIEVLANMAGIVAPGRDDSLSDLSLQDWNKVLEVNLTGTFLTTQAFYNRMVANGYGKIIFTGSLAGHVGSTRAGANYTSSKGAVHAFTKWVAKDGAEHGVYANAISPGPIKTQMIETDVYRPEMTPLNQLGEVEAIAEAVVYLGSQASNFVTGTVLHVNGGIVMSQ